MTDRERFLFYWLLRASQAFYREGWEDGENERETHGHILDVLSNAGFTLGSRQANAVLKTPPKPLYRFPKVKP